MAEPAAKLLLAQASGVGWRNAMSWFPGHMFKASKAMGERLSQVDLIIEVRDARVRLPAVAAATTAGAPSPCAKPMRPTATLAGAAHVVQCAAHISAR